MNRLAGWAIVAAVAAWGIGLIVASARAVLL